MEGKNEIRIYGNGKTTIKNMIAELLSKEGFDIGKTNSDYVDDNNDVFDNIELSWNNNLE